MSKRFEIKTFQCGHVSRKPEQRQIAHLVRINLARAQTIQERQPIGTIKTDPKWRRHDTAACVVCTRWWLEGFQGRPIWSGRRVHVIGLVGSVQIICSNCPENGHLVNDVRCASPVPPCGTRDSTNPARSLTT